MDLSLLARINKQSVAEMEKDPLIYDFGAIDKDLEDDSGTLWDTYTKTCYSRHPPVPALSLMRPILNGDKNSALFAHQNIGVNLPIILDLLTRSKVVSEVDFSDNALGSDIVEPLIQFVNESDQLSTLILDDNPMIGAKAMKALIEGIQEYRALEVFSIANTGCNQSVGPAVGQMVIGCSGLLKLNLSSCRLRASAIDISAALPQSSSLKRLDLSKNELFYGGKKLAVQLGSNAAKCATLARLNLSQNAISTDMANALLKGLADCPNLKRLDLSKNDIGEAAGRAICGFIQKCSSLQYLDISQNPILNVTNNQIAGQRKSEEGDGKQGGGNKKDKKPKAYVPSCYQIVNAIVKNISLKEVRMIGLVVDQQEWQQKIEQVPETISLVYKAPANLTFNFKTLPDNDNVKDDAE